MAASDGMLSICDGCFAGSFISKMMAGKGYHVFNFEEVMEDADGEVLRKQSQLCRSAKDIIDVLEACDSGFSSIFNNHERVSFVDPVGLQIEQAGNPAVDEGGARKQVELAHPDPERRCRLSHCPVQSAFVRAVPFQAPSFVLLRCHCPLQSAFVRVVHVYIAACD